MKQTNQATQLVANSNYEHDWGYFEVTKQNSKRRVSTIRTARKAKDLYHAYLAKPVVDLAAQNKETQIESTY